MRKLSFLAVVCCVISCSKKNDSISVIQPPTVTPSPAVAPDTLTPGWSNIKFQSAAETVNDVYFTDVNTGYITGSAGIFKTVNAGAAWNIAGTNAGYFNIAAFGNSACFVNATNSVTVTQNGGSGFITNAYNYPSGTPSFIDCFATSANISYLVDRQNIWKSTNGGSSFAITYTFASFSSGSPNLFFLNDNLGWVAFAGQLYKTSDGGINWTIQPQPAPGTFQISFTDPLNGYCAFGNNGSVGVSKTTDGGATWQIVLTRSSLSLIDISFVNSSTGYFSYDNKILKTTDAGATWTQVVAAGGTQLIEIHFTDASHGWACGTGGALLKYVL